MFNKNYNRKDVQIVAKCFFSKSTGEVVYDDYRKYYNEKK